MIGYERMQSPTVDSRREFAIEVLKGLSQKPKQLSSRFLYDARGSELFRRITELEEYYPTACEAEILEANKDQIVDLVPKSRFNLFELGAGEGKKTKILLDHFREEGLNFVYRPIDISIGAMKGLIRKLQVEYKEDLEVRGLVGDYFQGLQQVDEQSDPSFVLFLGANIGNFTRKEAENYLRHMWFSLRDGDQVLTGFDLFKDEDILRAAYNDSKGITAEFNLNLLDRINRELGGNFDRTKFRHRGHYDPGDMGMESWLTSREPQKVSIDALQRDFDFQTGEGIRTEFSYKYSRSGVTDLCESTGFEEVVTLEDSKGYFVDSIWRVRKNGKG